MEASLAGQTVKNPPAVQETQVQSQGQEDPLEKGTAIQPAFLPREFHGQRSLAGYSPRAHRESDTAEQLPLTLTGITEYGPLGSG